MVSNRQVGSFFFQVFFWVNNSRHFSVEKETPYGWFHWRRVFVFLSIKPFSFRSAQFRKKKRPTKTPPNRLLSQQAAGEWPCEGFSISKKWGHYRTPTPKQYTIIGKLPQISPYILRQVWYPPKMGNLMTPAETSFKNETCMTKSEFLGRIPRNLSANTAFNHICAWYLKWFASSGSSANDPLESHERSPNRPGNARLKLSRTPCWFEIAVGYMVESFANGKHLYP